MLDDVRPVIKVEGLRTRYGHVVAVEDVSFRIEKGWNGTETLALLGYVVAAVIFIAWRLRG